MVVLDSQRLLRTVQRLPFCYLCGTPFKEGDDCDRDHVPPETIFLPEDREPLILRTHRVCNGSYNKVDELIGQLIALRYGKVPPRRNRHLRIQVSPDLERGAVTNINIDQAVWRWVAGFHAALYKESLFHSSMRSLVVPFPKGQNRNGKVIIDPLLPQHPFFVEQIKTNRACNNLDRVVSNKGKMRYECFWMQVDGNGSWMCIFALDIYDWKDLGRTPGHPARGCAGCYVTMSREVPAKAARAKQSPIKVPNSDPLDPFGR